MSPHRDAAGAPGSGALEAKRIMLARSGLVPIAVTDRMAQDLLWAYANRAEAIDPAFARDLKAALHEAEIDHAKQRLRDLDARIEETRRGGFYDGRSVRHKGYRRR